MSRKTRRVERRRRYDDLEVGPFARQALEIAEKEVDIEAALVRLVDDDRVVGGELPVTLRFGKQNAVGHQLDERVRLRAVGKAHFVTHHIADVAAQFLRNARCHAARRDAARLSVADQAAHAAAALEADLRQLRRLARACLAANDHHRMLANRRRNLMPTFRYGQFRGIADARNPRRPRRNTLARCGHRPGQPLDLPGGRLASTSALDPHR